MARQKKCYGSSAKNADNQYVPVNGKGNAHQSRGGVPGVCVDSGHGSKANKNGSKKNYPKIPLKKDEGKK